MGNHVAGPAVGLAAKVVAKIRQQGETALSLLDRACKKYRGCDAEFESEQPRNGSPREYDRYTDPHPSAALGMLMVQLCGLTYYAPFLRVIP